MGISYVQEVIVKGIKDDVGAGIGLVAEVFLNDDKLKEVKIIDKETSLKRDIAEVCKSLPVYKHISKIIIRDKKYRNRILYPVPILFVSYNIFATEIPALLFPFSISIRFNVLLTNPILEVLITFILD